jgi:hypothetical protein
MSVRELDKIMSRLSVNENINPYQQQQQQPAKTASKAPALPNNAS